MNEAEYKEFMAFLFEHYVRPRMPRLRRHLYHHMMDEVHYHLDQAEGSAHILRFIERHDEDAYETFRLERLARAISETQYSLSFGNRITEEGGFLDAYEAHEREILQGLTARIYSRS